MRKTNLYSESYKNIVDKVHRFTFKITGTSGYHFAFERYTRCQKILLRVFLLPLFNVAVSFEGVIKSINDNLTILVLLTIKGMEVGAV